MEKAVLVRCCAACRTRAPRQTLLRIVRSPDGAIGLDRGPRRAAGRGAYLCRAAACIRKAPRALARALGASISGELLAELEREVNGNEG